MTDNDLFYHYLEVMNDWIFLLGKLNHLKESVRVYQLIPHYFSQDAYTSNENARSIARVNAGNRAANENVKNNNANKPMQNQMLNPFDISQNAIEEYMKKSGKLMQKNELSNLLQKKIRSDEIDNTIQYLLDQGYIVEEDDNHYLINL